jgi:hypothetical protein
MEQYLRGSLLPGHNHMTLKSRNDNEGIMQETRNEIFGHQVDGIEEYILPQELPFARTGATTAEAGRGLG